MPAQTAEQLENYEKLKREVKSVFQLVELEVRSAAPEASKHDGDSGAFQQLLHRFSTEWAQDRTTRQRRPS